MAQARENRRCGLYEYPIWFWDPRRWHIRDLLELRVCIVRTEEFRLRKREALAAYRSQITNLSGEPGPAPLRDGFLRQFLRPEEVFFEVVSTLPASGGG